MSYQDMYEQLIQENERHYRNTGVLHMLERNKQIKLRPQRFQEASSEYLRDVDFVFCLESRVFADVVDDLTCQRVPSGDMRPIHVLNLETEDSGSGAKTGAAWMARLARLLEDEVGHHLEEEISPSLLEEFEAESGLQIMYCLCFL